MRLSNSKRVTRFAQLAFAAEWLAQRRHPTVTASAP